MMTRMPTAVAAISILAAACGAGTQTDVAERAPEADARTAITAETEAFAQAFRDGDVDAILAKTTDDMVVTLTQGEFRGRAEVERFYRDFFAVGSVTSLDVRAEPLLIDGDLAIETGHYDETIVMSGEPPMDLSGSYLMVWQRQQDGAWRIGRFVGVDRMPAEE